MPARWRALGPPPHKVNSMRAALHGCTIESHAHPRAA